MLASAPTVCTASFIGAVVTYYQYLVLYQKTHTFVGETIFAPKVIPFDGVSATTLTLAALSTLSFVIVLICIAKAMGLQWKASGLLVTVAVLPALWLVALNRALVMHFHWLEMELWIRTHRGIGDFTGRWHLLYRGWVIAAILLFVMILAMFAVWVRQFGLLKRSDVINLVSSLSIFFAASVGAWVAYRTYFVSFFKQHGSGPPPSMNGALSFYGHSDIRLVAVALAMIWGLSIVWMLTAVARATGFHWRDALNLHGCTLLPVVWLYAMAEAVHYGNWIMTRGIGPNPNVVVYGRGLMGWSFGTVVLFVAFIISFLLLAHRLKNNGGVEDRASVSQQR